MWFRAWLKVASKWSLVGIWAVVEIATLLLLLLLLASNSLSDVIGNWFNSSQMPLLQRISAGRPIWIKQTNVLVIECPISAKNHQQATERTSKRANGQTGETTFGRYQAS